MSQAPFAISAGRETHATSRNNNTYGWQRICVTAIKDDQPVAAAAAQCFSPHQQEANNSGQKKKKPYGALALGATVDCVPSENKHNGSEL